MGRGGSEKITALIETDQSAIAAAHFALADLQKIAVILCYKRYTTDLAERFQEDLQKIEAGISVNRRWMAELKKAGVVLE